MLVDLHTHSKYSFDAQDEILDLTLSAIKKGFSYIAITDHKDYFWNKEPIALDIESVQNNIDKIRKEFSDKITVLKGIEIGEIYADKNALELTKNYNFDMVIGSLHSMPNDIDFYDMDYTKLDSDKLLKEYLLEVKKMCEYGGFDVLAHIDYPLRKMEKANIKPSFENYMEFITPVLKTIIDREIALEINAAGLFSFLNNVGPESFVLEEYKRLGGKMISIGSDAHYAKDIGRGIEECINHAINNGFEYLTIFENRKPNQIYIGKEKI